MSATRESKRAKAPANVVSRRRRRIVIIAAPPVRMLDVCGPAEVFTDANRLLGNWSAMESLERSSNHFVRKAFLHI
jgi:hypothetical protein